MLNVFGNMFKQSEFQKTRLALSRYYKVCVLWFVKAELCFAKLSDRTGLKIVVSLFWFHST